MVCKILDTNSARYPCLNWIYAGNRDGAYKLRNRWSIHDTCIEWCVVRSK